MRQPFRRPIVVLLTLPLALLLTAPLASGAVQDEPGPPPPDERGKPPWWDDAETPLQKHIKEKLHGRENAPTQKFELNKHIVPFQEESESTETIRALVKGGKDRVPAGKRFVIEAKTTLKYSGPQDAGRPQWGRFKVNKHPETGDPFEEDLTEEYERRLGEAFPKGEGEPDPDQESREDCSPENPCPSDLGVWERFDKGKEPRTYELTETITYIVPEETTQFATFATGFEASSPVEGPALMGFTYVGPNIDHTVGHRLRICIFGCFTIYDFRAGFALDWALGLRLPGAASLWPEPAPAEPLQAGQSYPLRATFTGQDWTAGDYSFWNVAEEGGGEYVMRFEFFVGVKAILFGADLCSNCYVEVDKGEITDFATPLGGTLPLFTYYLPIKEWDLALLRFSLGVTFTPTIDGPSVGASWLGTRASLGGGFSFPANGSPAEGEFIACLDGMNGPHQTIVGLDDFRFRMDSFALVLGAGLELTIFGEGAWSPSWNLASIDLGKLGGSDGLGAHQQCNALWQCHSAGPPNRLEVAWAVADEQAPTTHFQPTGTQIRPDSGWYTSDVNVKLVPVDLPAGCGIGVAQTISSGGSTDFSLTAEGETEVTYQSVDFDSNQEPPQTRIVRIDKTPPVISGAPTTTPNGYHWYNTNVVVHFDAADGTSGLASLTSDQTLTGDGADQSVTGTAVDNAGHTASTTVGDIDVDKTLPVVEISAPEPRTYANSDPLTIAWTASDNLSGIATEGATLDGRTVANHEAVQLLLLGAGQHEVAAHAVDRADNTGVAEVTFALEVDIHGLIAATRLVCELGWIGSSGICTSLLAKLRVVREQIGNGALGPAGNLLGAFVAELEAQSGRSVSIAAYDLLRCDAIFVREHLLTTP